jgi:hypothetical protein
VGDFIELFFYRVIDFFYPMAVNIAPQAAYAVDIAITFDIDQIEAFARFNNQWLAGEPLLHLRKWMPEILFVKAD